MCQNTCSVSYFDIDGHRMRQTPDYLAQFIHKLAKNSNYCPASSRVGPPGSPSHNNRSSFSVRTAPIAGAVQKGVHRSEHPCLLCHSYYPTLAGHQGERRMYDSMQREYDWSHMANEVYKSVRNCHKCARNKPSEKQRRSIQP